MENRAGFFDIAESMDRFFGRTENSAGLFDIAESMDRFFDRMGNAASIYDRTENRMPAAVWKVLGRKVMQ